jgi:RNA polymerase sigma-70 factor (ECF subfamily)
MNERTDAELVQACLAGENQAFETLVRKYHQAIYNLALRMVKEPEDAEDIAQSVFVKAYEKLDTYKPSHQFFSWIYRIGINESINFAKKRKRLDEYESGVSGFREETPEDEVGDDDLGEQIADAIMLLKVDYRMVIVLKHFHDYTYQEMSDVLDIPEKTVKSRLFSARQQLRRILESEGIQL